MGGRKLFDWLRSKRATSPQARSGPGSSSRSRSRSRTRSQQSADSGTNANVPVDDLLTLVRAAISDWNSKAGVRFVKLGRTASGDFTVELVGREPVRRQTYIAVSHTWWAFSPQAEGYLQDAAAKLALVARTLRLSQSILLWMDQLCIRQDDSADVSANLAEVRAIYAGAEAVWIFAAGDPAKRMQIRIGARPLGSDLIALRKVYPGLDAWVRRLWTFKEAIVARKLLVFAHSHGGELINIRAIVEATLSGTAATDAEVDDDTGFRDTSEMLVMSFSKMAVARKAGLVGLLHLENDDGREPPNLGGNSPYSRLARTLGHDDGDTHLTFAQLVVRSEGLVCSYSADRLHAVIDLVAKDMSSYDYGWDLHKATLWVLKNVPGAADVNEVLWALGDQPAQGCSAIALPGARWIHTSPFEQTFIVEFLGAKGVNGGFVDSYESWDLTPLGRSAWREDALRGLLGSDKLTSLLRSVHDGVVRDVVPRKPTMQQEQWRRFSPESVRDDLPEGMYAYTTDSKSIYRLHDSFHAAVDALNSPTLVLTAAVIRGKTVLAVSPRKPTEALFIVADTYDRGSMIEVRSGPEGRKELVDVQLIVGHRSDEFLLRTQDPDDIMLEELAEAMVNTRDGHKLLFLN